MRVVDEQHGGVCRGRGGVACLPGVCRGRGGVACCFGGGGCGGCLPEEEEKGRGRGVVAGGRLRGAASLAAGCACWGGADGGAAAADGSVAEVGGGGRSRRRGVGGAGGGGAVVRGCGGVSAGGGGVFVTEQLAGRRELGTLRIVAVSVRAAPHVSVSRNFCGAPWGGAPQKVATYFCGAPLVGCATKRKNSVAHRLGVRHRIFGLFFLIFSCFVVLILCIKMESNDVRGNSLDWT